MEMNELLPSKPIQIITANHPGGCNCGPYVQLFALCEDGSIWMQYHSSGCSNVPTDGSWHLAGKTLHQDRDWEGI